MLVLQIKLHSSSPLAGLHSSVFSRRGRHSPVVVVAIHHSSWSPFTTRLGRHSPLVSGQPKKRKVILRANVDSLLGFLIIIKYRHKCFSSTLSGMGRKKLRESLKIKEDDRFPSRVSGYCNWESIRLIKAILSHKQLDMFRVICFGYLLDMSDTVLSGQFCHHILLRECHVRDVDDTASTLWFYVGNEVIRNLGPDNNVSDDDMVKLALVLFLEMTLIGKDDMNAIMYWALQLVDDLDAFNSFPWGTFLYGRTFNSLSTCIVGRDDKYNERLESPAKRKAEKYNVYGFVTSFQVWEIEAIPKWAMLGYASRLNIFKYLVPSDEEIRKPYWVSIDQSQIPIDPMIVSPEKFDCGVDDDDFEVDVHEDIDNVNGGAEKIYDDCKDVIQHSNVGYEIKKEVNPTSFKKDQGESKKGWKRLKEMEIRLKEMQTQQDEYQQEVRDEMTSMKNEMRIGFLRLSELICKSKNEKTCHNVDTDVINLSQNNNIHFQPSTFHRVFPSPEMAKGNSEPSDDVKQLSRPPKITIKVTRDRKRSAYTVSPYIDPTAKRPRKPKMPEFGRDSPLEEDVLRSMNSWVNDNNMNTSHLNFMFMLLKLHIMHTGVFEANPHWFQILLSEIGWLDGDILFPANVNGNHRVAIAVDLKEWVITIYDYLPEINSVLEITK
ncbi:hypothetical protein Ddye_027439 [Dipteronia dyeriana]|uniref:DUF1985 domain-containing protein n=1 Tax=Dipteronia dyeriana TaxID=168575 RepID=A0AAD9WQ62_9ROSI|nr:hypothetical protein Ddye_027439 [Dipteronia dyeriana]